MSTGILGFDASLVSSGFAYLDSTGEYHTGRIQPKKLRGMERLEFIRDSFDSILGNVALTSKGKVKLIVYEDYAMGVKGGRTFSMGELGGVLKLLAWSLGVDVLLVPPSNLKQFATGKGNADKEGMMQAVADKWAYSITQNDEADAFCLLKLGEYYLKPRKRASIQTKALAGCTLYKGQQI